MKGVIAYFRETLLRLRLIWFGWSLKLANLGVRMPSSRITNAAASIGAPAVELLSKQIRSEDETARHSAILFLGNLGRQRNPLALFPLIDALDSPDSLVRYRAIVPLAALKDPRSVRPLILTAVYDWDRDNRNLSITALSRITPSGEEDLCFLHGHILNYPKENASRPRQIVKEEMSNLAKLYFGLAGRLDDIAKERYRESGVRPPPRFRTPPKKSGRHNSAERMQNTAAQMKAATGGRRA
jgi:hypothetical protein